MTQCRWTLVRQATSLELKKHRHLQTDSRSVVLAPAEMENVRGISLEAQTLGGQARKIRRPRGCGARIEKDDHCAQHRKLDITC